MELQLKKPDFPQNWDYEKSIAKVRPMIFKWKNLTAEIAYELYIARLILAEHGGDRRSNQRNESSVETWSNYCKEIGSSRQVVNRWLNRWFPRPKKQINLPLPSANQYAVIYADPPWSYSNSGFDQSAKSQYPTMTVEEICNLEIGKISAAKSVLFLWATNPLLPEAIEVMRAWNFQYKTNIAWIKNKGPGIGWYVKSRHELLLIGVKSNTPHPKEKMISWFQADVQKHSQKPEVVYENIERIYPGPLDDTFYVELFARRKKRGWKVWGNEI